MITLGKVYQILVKAQLLKDLTIAGQLTVKFPIEMHDEEVLSIAYDSRKASDKTLFFCKGQTFKATYLEKAIANGASFYVSEVPYEVSDEVVAIIVTDIKKAMALLSMAFFDYPQEKLKVIAFTGTKGKTTAAYFTQTILAAATHHQTALISTMETMLDGVTATKSHLTTPESLDLYTMMHQALEFGMTHLVMEVSSQAYKTDRVYGLHFDVGIFMNISPDHIGVNEHPNFEDYFYCKRQLLKNSSTVIINADADYFTVIKDVADKYADEVLVYASQSTALADYYFQTGSAEKGQYHFAIQAQADDFLNLNGNYQIELAGDFNQSNALAAVMAANIAGATSAAIHDGLAQTKIAGRMETLQTANGAMVYIDYAHNYISLQSLLTFVKKQHPSANVTVVLGSPGDKGESRRADFATVLNELATQAILTTDDPGFEDPAAICQQIKAGIGKKVQVETILDRETAIQTALQTAQSTDVVVLAGKGSDPYQKINGQDRPYATDSVIAKEWIGRGL